DDRELRKSPQLMGNRRRGCAGVEHHTLALLHHLCGCFGDSLLFLRVLPLLFLERWIEQGAGLDPKSSAMCALDQSFGLQVLKIFSDRDLGDAEISRKVSDEDTSFFLDQRENVLSPLLNQELTGLRGGYILRTRHQVSPAFRSKVTTISRTSHASCVPRVQFKDLPGFTGDCSACSSMSMEDIPDFLEMNSNHTEVLSDARTRDRPTTHGSHPTTCFHHRVRVRRREQRRSGL